MTICFVGGIINFCVVLHIEIDDYRVFLGFEAKTVITVYLPMFLPYFLVNHWGES